MKDKELHKHYKGLSASAVKKAFSWNDEYKTMPRVQHLVRYQCKQIIMVWRKYLQNDKVSKINEKK